MEYFNKLNQKSFFFFFQLKIFGGNKKKQNTGPVAFKGSFS